MIKIKEENLEYRMYGLVPYNLSDIQKGIQFGHAVVEYMLNFPVDLKIYKDTKKWAREDKTFIILNGGTTSLKTYNDQDKEFTDGKKHFGTLNNHLKTLRVNNVKVASFYEPDLGDQLTGVVFIADERVFDVKKYPPIPKNSTLYEVFPKFDIYDYENNLNNDILKNSHQGRLYDSYISFVEKLGGPKNLFLRKFVKQFKLA